MLIPLLNEACYALYEGLGTPADIDTGVRSASTTRWGRSSWPI
jgi:3-hydroxyacyl-CoA dehydrogenase